MANLRACERTGAAHAARGRAAPGAGGDRKFISLVKETAAGRQSWGGERQGQWRQKERDRKMQMEDSEGSERKREAEDGNPPRKDTPTRAFS